MEHLPPAPIGERFSGERRVFGEYETVAVAVDDLIRLPQVRSGTNPDLPDLKESIKANGLLNPIDIAVMDEAGAAAVAGLRNQAAVVGQARLACGFADRAQLVWVLAAPQAPPSAWGCQGRLKDLPSFGLRGAGTQHLWEP